MKLIITESQLKGIVNEMFDDYKLSSTRGKTIGKIYSKLNPNKELSVGLGSGKGFTSKYEKSEIKRKASIDKEEVLDKIRQDFADKVKQDIINKRRMEMDKEKELNNRIPTVINGDLKPLKIITQARQFENEIELRKRKPYLHHKLQKMGLMDKTFPKNNI